MDESNFIFYDYLYDPEFKKEFARAMLREGTKIDKRGSNWNAYDFINAFYDIGADVLLSIDLANYPSGEPYLRIIFRMLAEMISGPFYDTKILQLPQQNPDKGKPQR